MSGSVAEALLASSGGSSKKLPLLPPPPKIKKEPKTFCFELKLEESTDTSYPEFSWTELIRGAKEKEISKRVESGKPGLDPFASDDEDDLKAMAAKFEAKYNAVPPKKKKHRVADCIDRGAGYDETDPFIDNSDVYDEVVPPDLQTVHGGFYINSGSLDFKEVELSEDEEDSLSQPPKPTQPPKKAKVKITPTLQERSQGLLQKDINKNPVGRPPGSGIKRSLSNDKNNTIPKKRRIIVTPVGPEGRKIIGSKLSRNKHLNKGPMKPRQSGEGPINMTAKKPNPNRIESSSSSGSGSSSSDESGSGSSSSDSESSSSEETQEKEKEKQKPKLLLAKAGGPPPAPLPMKAPLPPPPPIVEINNTPSVTSAAVPKPKPIPRPVPLDSGLPNLPKTQVPNPLKRVKTKNVPLNPKLHPNLSQRMSSTPPPAQSPANLNSTAQPPPPPLLQQPQKSMNKDLIKANGSTSLLMNLNARAQLQSQGTPQAPPPTSSPSGRVPTPKPVSTPSASPGGGLTISAVTPSPPNNPKPAPAHQNSTSSNAHPKVKAKQKQVSSSSSSSSITATSMPTISPLDIFNSIANYSSSLERPNLSNFPNLSFVPAISTNSSLLKSGMGLMPSQQQQKSMPNLKKMPHQQQQGQNSTPPEKLVHHQSQPKPKVQKVAKPKPKISPVVSSSPSPSNISTSTPSSIHSGTFSGGTMTSSFLTPVGSYKASPPPLGGPGVDISKARTTPSSELINSTPKASPKTSSLSASSASALSLGNASIVYSPGNALSTSAIVSSILSSSPNSLVNSVPSSLTVQRLPQSITITPSGHYSGGSATSNASTPTSHETPKTTKKFTPFDVSALLQNPTVSYASSLIMNSNSAGTGGSGATSKSGASSKAANSIVNRDLNRKQ